jgi:transcription-repair coupling factor (superfamily II helicase)
VTVAVGAGVYFLLHRLVERGDRPIVFVAENNQAASRAAFYARAVSRLVAGSEPSESEYAVFPDYEPSNLIDYQDPDVALVEERNRVFEAVAAGTAKAIFTPLRALLRYALPPDAFYAGFIRLTTERSSAATPAAYASRMQLSALSERLSALGYERTGMVVEEGQFSQRGGIMDVFAVGEDLPVRIDFFGDDIDEMSFFDPVSQRSLSRLTRFTVLPYRAGAIALTPERQAAVAGKFTKYKKTCRDVFESALERIVEIVEGDLGAMKDGAVPPRAGFYTEFAGESFTTLVDYLPGKFTVVAAEENLVLSETLSYLRFWENRFADWRRNGYSFLDVTDYYKVPVVTLDALRDAFESSVRGKGVFRATAFGAPNGDKSARPAFAWGLEFLPHQRWLSTKLAETLKTEDLADDAVIVTNFASRVREMLAESEVFANVHAGVLPQGFRHPSGLHLLTDHEIFGEVEIAERAPGRFSPKTALKSKDELKFGDFVVHVDYGIGKFIGLTENKIGGVVKSYVEIEYDEGDKLYVPVEQLDRLRIYRFGDSAPKLSNLNRDLWRRTKAKVKSETEEIALRLLDLYKKRKLLRGIEFSPTTVWESEFEEGFPYEMTSDQAHAWEEVVRDMESPRPMDRLVCGDVGFGKTEIALRAAFKAVVDGRQVLMLCPTTILADQHYHTFRRRFKPFPFRVELLSRFRTKKEQTEVLRGMAAGTVDVVIGTHRILSKDVQVKNLGLLIVDEEQRFGVMAKEKWKEKHPGVDVLTLTATPIPRTLHMSLIGIRDISLIETAPVERKSVKTYVGEYDPLLVRDAILREVGRGGQVYFLHNLVEDIEVAKKRVLALAPDARISVAHGRMSESRLEEIMNQFAIGASDILLSTTIIENGLDIPNVNTLVVDGAENLGLAQMHQLRGRVGRSHLQAFAYFFHAPERILTRESQSRLRAIYNYAYLGAGYEIAQSDLRIRGAGNVLGEEQHGLAKQVGFDYYCEMLARSINSLKVGEEGLGASADFEESPSCVIDVPIPAFIPPTYIDDLILRLDVLRNIAALRDEASILDYESEIEDRFGDVPPEVENLLKIISLKNLATQLGIKSISHNRVKNDFRLTFDEADGPWFRKITLVDGVAKLAEKDSLDLAIPLSADVVTKLEDFLKRLFLIRPPREKRTSAPAGK